MIAKVVTILGFVVNAFFLIGAIQKLLPYIEFNSSINIFGLLWPSLVWLTFVIANLIFLRYLIRLGKDELIKKKYIFISIVLLLTPHFISYLLGLYFTFRFINSVNY